MLKLLLILWKRSGRKNGSATTQRKAYTNNAQTDFVIRGEIEHLPQVRVRFVIDGDTFTFSKGWNEIRVRLDSIDCPEDGQPWGDVATFALMKLIGRKTVHLEEHGVDVHGRMLATVYVWSAKKDDWLNVNEHMVTLGHAWVMRQFYGHLPKDRQEKLNRLENWAKSRKKGLWDTSNPIPPWTWRLNGDFRAS